MQMRLHFLRIFLLDHLQPFHGMQACRYTIFGSFVTEQKFPIFFRFSVSYFYELWWQRSFFIFRFQGCVYVKCANLDSAGRAFRSIYGNWFDGILFFVKHTSFSEGIKRTFLKLEKKRKKKGLFLIFSPNTHYESRRVICNLIKRLIVS